MKHSTADAVIPFLISAALGFVAVSSQSLWIDEANSAVKALQPSWDDFWRVMVKEKGSDIQMPGYMITLRLWARNVSNTEFGLRSFNILWLLGAQAAFCFALRTRSSLRAWTIAAASVSPFLWAYMDEARPSALQFCGGRWRLSQSATLPFQRIELAQSPTWRFFARVP